MAGYAGTGLCHMLHLYRESEDGNRRHRLRYLRLSPTLTAVFTRRQLLNDACPRR